MLAGKPANLRADVEAPVGLRAATDVTEYPAEDSGRPIVVGKENIESVGERWGSCMRRSSGTGGTRGGGVAWVG